MLFLKSFNFNNLTKFFAYNNNIKWDNNIKWNSNYLIYSQKYCSKHYFVIYDFHFDLLSNLLSNLYFDIYIFDLWSLFISF